MSHERHGAFVAIVGASGAGKDSILRYASARLREDPRYSFVRRVITRPCDPASEDHGTLDADAFAAAEKDGAFAISWASHGLLYGLPASADEQLRRGAVVVANVSRAVVSVVRERYPSLVTVEITADPAILAERLSGRGRESGEAIERRLARPPTSADERLGWVSIENNGALAEAGERLLAILRACAVSNERYGSATINFSEPSK